MASRLMANWTLGNFVAGQTAPMGALTLANSANGYQITTVGGAAITGASITGGTATGASLTAGGLLYPTTNGSLSAQDGKTVIIASDQGAATITLSVEANVYSCGQGQLSAILALGLATIDGKTIKGRPSADIQSTTPGNSISFSTSLNFTTGLTITSHDITRPCFLRRQSLACSGPLTYKSVTLRDDFIVGTDATFTGLITNANNTTARLTLTLDCVEMYCTTSPANYDPTIRVSGTAAAHTGGVSSTTLQFTNNPDLSGISGGHNYQIEVGSTVKRIVSVDNVAKTVVLDGAMNISAGSPVNYRIADAWKFLTLMISGGGLTFLPDIVIRDSYLHDATGGMNMTGRSLDMQRNLISNIMSDTANANILGTETAFLVKDNAFTAMAARSQWVGNPHSDIFQLNDVGITQVNASPYTFIGNRVWPATGKGTHQGFFANLTTAFGMVVDFRHNMIMGREASGSTFDNFGNGSIVKWNTFVHDKFNLADGNAEYAPALAVTGETGTVAVENNAGHSISFTGSPLSSAAAANNYNFTADTNLAIGTALAGTDFSSRAYGTLAAWTAAMMPKSGGPLDTASPKIGAGAYYAYDAIPPPAGSRSGLGTGVDTSPS